MPFQPIAAPVTSVKTVTESVPYLTRDLTYWPCIAGENFPPVRTSAAAYGVVKGLPAITIPSTSLATASSAIWSQFPLPSDKTLLQLSHYVNITDGGAGGLTLVEVANVAAATAPTQQLGLTWSRTGTTFWTGIAGGGALAAAYDYNTWLAGYRKVSYQLGTGVARILIDGITVVDLTAAQAAAVVPSLPFSAGLSATNPTTLGAAAPTLNLAGIETRWT